MKPNSNKIIVAVLAPHPVAFRRFKGTYQKQNEQFVQVSSVADTEGKTFHRIDRVAYWASFKDAKLIEEAANKKLLTV